MALKVMDLFKVVLIIQLFYAVSITLIAYSIPEDAQDYVTAYSDIASSINLNSVATDVQDSIDKQTKLPIVELGALVFYSGNILIDLILNFAFAIPQMIGLVISGIRIIFNLDIYVIATVQLFATAVVAVMYFIGVIQLLTGIRSGRLI